MSHYQPFNRFAPFKSFKSFNTPERIRSERSF